LLAFFDGVSFVIDYMGNLTKTIEEYTQRVSEVNTWGFRSLDAAVDHHRVGIHEGVGSDTICLMVCNVVSNFVSRKLFVSIVFLSDIIWKLGLVEEGFAVLTVPLEHVSKSMFACQSIAKHIVTIDLKTGINWILGVRNRA
jgi:hypothetical protein